MNITQDEVVDSQTTLHIELEDADLDPYLDRAYRQVVGRMAVPGFRRGKAPRSVVESLMGRETLLNEVLEYMVSDVISRAVEEQELDTVGSPSIDDLDMDPVQFKATLPLRPDVQLGDYRSIRVDYSVDEVSENDIAERLDRLRESLGTWESVDRPPQFEDLTTISFKGIVDGEEVWNRENSTFYLHEEGGSPVPGFAANLVNAELGSELEFTVAVPDDFRNLSVAGKDALFSATVHDVKERALPELNDEFAQSLPDGFETLEDLRKAVADALERDSENSANAEYITRVMEALLEQTHFEIPPLLLENEIDRLMSEQSEYLRNANIRMDDYLTSRGMTEDEARGEAREQAEQRIRRNFTINRITTLENPEVSATEIDERYNHMQSGQSLRRRERREMREHIEDMLKYEKTVDLLISIAKGETDDNDSDREEPRIPEGGESHDNSEA